MNHKLLPREKRKRRAFRGCFIKKRFETLALANRRAEQIAKCSGKIMRVYQCPKCRKFHLTSKVTA